MLGFNQLGVSAQESNFTIVLNPGATNSDSQNPISPANITVPAGTNVTWINSDSSPHMLVSGTPNDGPDNKFYGDFFGTDENYTVTFDEPGLYSYDDPVWSHIRGVITVENPEFSSELGSISNDSSVNGIDENPVLDSNTTNVINSNVDSLATSEDGSSSFPLSSFSSSFPNSTTNNVSDQPSTPYHHLRLAIQDSLTATITSSHNLTNPLVSVTLIINPHSRLRPPILKSLIAYE